MNIHNIYQIYKIILNISQMYTLMNHGFSEFIDLNVDPGDE